MTFQSASESFLKFNQNRKAEAEALRDTARMARERAQAVPEVSVKVMINNYLPVDAWTALRDAMALRALPVEYHDDEVMVDMARTKAAELLAEQFVMPEDCRDDVA